MKFVKLFAVLFAIAGISATTIQRDKLYEISKNIEIFINVYKELNANYVDDLDPNQLMRVGIDAMVGSLDPYTNYISESEVASYMINTEGRYEGIGAIVEKIGDYVTIIEPYEDSPVLEAGLKAGDQIIAIEGQSTLGKSKEEVSNYYRGVPGTSIRMRIRTAEGEEKEVDLTRREVSIPNVPYNGFVDDNIAYVSLTTFTMNASKNIKKALREMKNENENIEGIILDLRDNGGGLLREAIAVSNVFIPKDKEVVSVKSKVRERDESYRSLEDAYDLETPVVVLINKNSASASEIVSGVLQDYDRAILMGQRSYGKGLVQNTKEVGYNSRIKLTTSKYYIPSGRCIQSVQYEDGEPVDIPDEKRSKFKTSNGRTVLDGGGVSPDVYLEVKEDPEILEALKKQFMIFAYTNRYAEQMDSSEMTLEIEFKDFEDFKRYVASRDFTYKTKSEKTLNKLNVMLESQNIEGADNHIDEIESMVLAKKENALERDSLAIIDAIELALATRLNYQTGKVYQKLKNDSEIVSAIELLKDTNRYNAILNGTE